MGKITRSPSPRPKQLTPQELLDDLLAFLQRKFYEGYPVAFAKDRPRLLKWVVLWPAKWLEDRGVTLPPDQYKKLFTDVFMDGLRYGNTGQIAYLPAWLAKVIQSHFEHHEDEIYAQAKSMRNLVESSLSLAGKLPTATPPDPVRQLAAARRLLKPKKQERKPAKNNQLNLL
jgi:hypothetical protein